MVSQGIEREIHEAQSLQRAGQLTAAEQRYRRVLSRAPHSSPALCMLGVLLCSTRREVEGVALLERAAQLRPNDPDIQFNLGCALERAECWADAAAAFARAVRAASQDAEAHFRLAGVLRKQGQLETALQHYRQAVTLSPGDAIRRTTLGMICRETGRLSEAVDAYEAATRLLPSSGEAQCNLGLVLWMSGRTHDALRSLEAAAGMLPGHSEVLNNLGFVLREAGQLERAREVLWRAAELHPQHAGIHANLANTLLDLNEAEASLPHYRQALSSAASADVRTSYAMALWVCGERQAAIEHYRKALLLDPQHPDAQLCLGLHALAGGDYSAWDGYEHRWRTRDGRWRVRDFTAPLWEGQALADKRLLIHTEQGVGDEIMFASLFPEIIAEAGAVSVECTAKTEALFRRSFPQAQVICTNLSDKDWKTTSATRLEKQANPDCQVPAGTLPRFRRRSLAEFPRHCGYLRADDASIEYWRQKLDKLGDRPKIGIGWRGGTARSGIHRRSVGLLDLLPLLSRADVQFVSLQYTDCEQELAEFAAATGIEIPHWREAIDDYDQTAALVCALDLVVSVCTSLVHLTGALGRPVWIIAPAVPEWRYGLSGTTMPWYPSARIFRQQVAGDWSTVLSTLVTALSADDWRAH